MDNRYDAAGTAARWYDRWEQQGFFKSPQQPAADKKSFCIILPPPNVTGTLHMGHGFQVSLIDTLIRYHRMLGDDVLWQGGADHAGIATQMVVERQLEAQGLTRIGMGRDAFVERVWQWKEQSGNTIAQQLRRLGASIDWSRDRFTMDEHYCTQVTDTFVRLYEEGLIYRANRMSNWDPVLQTALSDLEVDERETDGHLWHIRYPLRGRAGQSLTVATTRPETMLGDCAVAVHPDDKRYAAMVGAEVELPITGRLIPVIADDFVDPEFGTGCVKITPAHDFNDFEAGQRNKLKTLCIMDLAARIVSGEDAEKAGIPQSLRGLTREDARTSVLQQLKTAGALTESKKHRHKVPHGDRSGAALEPMLTEQWFMNTQPLAERALQAVAEGETRFTPELWSNTYNRWLEEIRDWCISRQLWWGHQIPAWYDKQGNIYVARSAEEAAEQARKAGYTAPLTRDDSVLDTWFSASMWSFVPLGWPKRSGWHPTSVLVTGFDIIFFWVARMMMMTLHLLGEVPFRTIYTHGLVRDARGQKMSKSKGNILDPIDLIDGIALEELVAKRTTGLMQPHQRNEIEQRTRRDFPNGLEPCGADALRFTFCTLATGGRDIHFDTSRIEGYRNFCNKIWNASRFVLKRLEGRPDGVLPALPPRCLPERWILSRLQATVQSVRDGLDAYRLDWAAQSLYDFIWHQYCDWYLECAKAELDSKSTSDERRDEILSVMTRVLEQLLRLTHPFMPFISEELWQKVVPLTTDSPEETLMLASFPDADKTLTDSEAETDFDWLIRLVNGLRQLRGEAGIHPAHKLELLVSGGSKQERGRLQQHAELVCTLAGTLPPRTLRANEAATAAALQVVDGLRILVPLADLIDLEQERQRLKRNIEQLEKRAEGWRGKLQNKSFSERAPADIVGDVQRQLEEAERQLLHLHEQLAALSQ